MSQEVDKAALLRNLGQKLASKALSQQQLTDMANAIAEAKIPVIDYDICIYGTCCDHIYDGGLPDLDLSVFADERLGLLRKIEIFPEGIPPRMQSRIRVSHSQ